MPQSSKSNATPSAEHSAKGMEANSQRQEHATQRKQVENAQNSVQASSAAQLVKKAEAFSSAKVSPVQRKANKTGLPDQLKSGIESLSGISMDNVRVNFNSSKPAQLQAHAYAQGEQIHIAPGQEKHLAHEAWHVVQQKQGRVKATKQMKGKVKINDDTNLEREADQMGAKALSAGKSGKPAQLKTVNASDNPAQLVSWAKDKLNVVGEDHDESDLVRPEEKQYFHVAVGGGYWTENMFMVQSKNEQGASVQTPADPTSLRALAGLHDFVRLSKGFNKEEVPSPDVILSIAFNVHLATFELIDLALNHWKATKGVRYPTNLTKAETATRDNRHNSRFVALQAIKSDLNSLVLMKNEKMVGANRVQVREFYKKIRDNRKLLTANLMEKPVLDELRSQKMHEAANAHANQVGVWKIGDDHVKDILRNGDKWGPRKYNLITMGQFEEMAKNPTPAEAKAMGAYNKKK